MELKLSALSQKIYQFTYRKNGETHHVKITLPALEKLPLTVRGDWAPNYTFALSAHTPVLLSLNGESFTLEMPELRIEAPMLAKEREQVPLFIVIVDEHHSQRFHLGLDRDYQLAKVEVIEEPKGQRVFLGFSENLAQMFS